MSIAIVEYDPSWPERFEVAAGQLREALSGVALRVDHIGSTAVPGLVAKPLIDIQISVGERTAEAAYRVPLVALDYTHTTLPFPYFHQPASWPHTHHIHVRVAGSEDEQRTLGFRDWLRGHPVDRTAYAVLKQRLAEGADAETAAGRFRYSEAKTDFVRRIEGKARLAGRPLRPVTSI